MLKIRYSAKFKKDFKLAQKRRLPLQELKDIIEKLASGKTLDAKHRDHALSGNYAMFRECHIRPDWLLIYRINDDSLELLAHRTGTHSDLFI
ncbi:MAG: type II toxin-antitoxin system YafQ family toxin [Selenomonas ruminantium]|jgi:mRNA interferase YafQ|nr:type II toxin-antitoxin system YafQ family toxin [Selenomonas ruminantium]